MERARPKGYYFLTPVWGESYTRLFLDIALPALLAPGNLPVFKGEPNTQFIIFTTLKDAETIRASQVFQDLSAIITVNIEYILTPAPHKLSGQVPKHDIMSDCHRRGLIMADAADAATLFLNPDLVFSDGSFATVKRLVSEGKDVILVSGIRTIKQTVPQALTPYLQDNILTVPSRDLMRITLDNLHPLAHSSFWDEEGDDLIPANLYWRAGDEGIVARCYHLHIILIYPQRKNTNFFSTIDADLVLTACPDNRYDHIIADSDDFLMIELSDKSQMYVFGIPKESVAGVVDWAELGAHKRHREFLQAPIYMRTGDSDQQAWQAATAKSDRVVADLNKGLARSSLKLLLADRVGLAKRLRLMVSYERLARANAGRQLQLLPFNKKSKSVLGSKLRQRGLDILLALRRLVIFGVAKMSGAYLRFNCFLHTMLAKAKCTGWQFKHSIRNGKAKTLFAGKRLCKGLGKTAIKVAGLCLAVNYYFCAFIAKLFRAGYKTGQWLGRLLNKIYRRLTRVYCLASKILMKLRAVYDPYEKIRVLWYVGVHQHHQGRRHDAIKTWTRAMRLQQKQLRKTGTTDAPRIFPGAYWLNAIGHISLFDFFAKKRALGMTANNYIVLAPPEAVANQAYLNLWQDHFEIISDLPHLRLYSHNLSEEYPAVFDVAGEWLWSHNAMALVQERWEAAGHGPLLTLPPEHIHRARAWLAQHYNMPADAWFVTLHVREDGPVNGMDHDTASIRNADISLYLKAIKKITAAGGWVIRTGYNSASSLPDMPQVIDYAMCQIQQDWLDVFFYAQCRFAIATNSGPAFVLGTFGVPTILTNWGPIGDLTHYSNTITLPKLLWSFDKGRCLNFAEQFSEPYGILDSEKILGEFGLKALSNTPQDIMLAVEEMMTILSPLWQPAPDDEMRQAQFKQIAENADVLFRGRLGAAFLKHYEGLLEPTKI